MLPRSYKDVKLSPNAPAYVSHAGLGKKEFNNEIIDPTTFLDIKSPTQTINHKSSKLFSSTAKMSLLKN